MTLLHSHLDMDTVSAMIAALNDFRVGGRMSHVTRHTSHVTRHTSHVTRHREVWFLSATMSISFPLFATTCELASHVTRHSSHVTRHTSHVTRHTLHVTRLTSHVTRHTSHVTRHTGTCYTTELCPISREISKSAFLLLLLLLTDTHHLCH